MTQSSELTRTGRLIACTDYPAYEQDISGQRTWGGNNIRFLNEVVKRAGLQLDFMQQTQFESCLEMLRIGRVDIMVGLLSSEQRARDYFLLPYHHGTSQSLFTRPGEKEDAVRFLAKIKGYQRPVIDDPVWRQSQHIEVTKPVLGLRMLVASRIDAVVLPENTGKRLMERDEFKGQLAVRPLQVSPDARVNIAITREGYGSRYVEQLKAVLENMKENNQIDSILERD